jgi:hypothetical protein
MKCEICILLFFSFSVFHVYEFLNDFNIFVNSNELIKLQTKSKKRGRIKNNAKKEKTKIYKLFLNNFCSNTFKNSLFLSNYKLINLNFRKKDINSNKILIKNNDNNNKKIKNINLNRYRNSNRNKFLNNFIEKHYLKHNIRNKNITNKNITNKDITNPLPKNNHEDHKKVNDTSLKEINISNKEKEKSKEKSKEKEKNMLIRVQNSMFNERISAEVTPLGLRLDNKIKSIEPDYNIVSREISFIISEKLNCHSFIREKLVLESIKDFNLIEHWILPNNFDNVEINSIKSPDAQINFYYFNKKFSLLSIYFTPNNKIDNNSYNKPYKNHKYNNKNFTENIRAREKNNENKSQKFFHLLARKKYIEENFDHNYKRNYTFEFEYIAYNLIFSHNGGSNSLLKDYKNWGDNYEKNNDKKLTYYNNPNFEEGYNYIIWKFFNKNFIEEIKNLKISIDFDLSFDFVNYPVLFSPPFQMSFKKSLIVKDKHKFVKYETNFKIQPQEVIILDMKFPLIFYQCNTGTPSVFMVAILSILIIFMILIIYIVFSIFYYNTIL